MKKIVSLILSMILLVAAFPAPAEGNVTVKEWLDAEGQCGECVMTVTVSEVLNPVLAVVDDGTAQVNLFGIRLYDSFYGFGENGFLAGDALVIADPVYNIFGDSVEMADAQLADIIVPDEGFVKVSVQQWLEAKGETGSCVMIVKIMDILNPVLAMVADGSGSVNLFGVQVNGEFTDFVSLGLKYGDLLVLVDPAYNEFEGNIEMADSILYRVITCMGQDDEAE